MRFKVLGEIGVDRDGSTVRLGGWQQRRLLGLLLSERGRVVSTDRIVDALWSHGEPPDGAARSAMKYVSRLRAALGDSLIVTVGAGYRLVLDGHGFDVDEFEDLVDHAGRAMPDAAVAHYDHALALWVGPAYGEFGEEWWARPEASRLTERRMAALIARAAAQMAMGHHNRAIPELEHLVVEHPLDERPVRLLMQSLQVTGRRPEALRIGAAFRRRLVDETGLDPSSELLRLESAIAAGVEPPVTNAGRPLRGYTIHDSIGEGTHGRVYVATQPGTERRVAIKVIRPDLADSAEFVRRFEAEAQLVARLEHPHIVPLYDYWREPGGAFLVFRLLSGGTARDSVISGGPWSVPRVSRLVEEMAAALMSAHSAGVTHNDVKPSNVLLDDDGASYLTDFGIAGAADDLVTGVAADIQDLAWLVWELLTGERPARVSWPRDASAGRVGVPSLIGRMPSVPDGLDAVLRRTHGGGYDSVAEFVLAWRAATDVVAGGPGSIGSDARRAAAQRLAVAAMAGVNPYRGLRAFDEADAASFHGRDHVVADLVEMTRTHRLVTVVGASGSGKSSVVHAGLVPQLRAGGGAIVATMIPGEVPLEALRTGLSQIATVAVAEGASDGDLIETLRRTGPAFVVVDQFEECWTRARSEDREAFLDTVAAAVDDESIDVRFVVTVRADLLDRPLEHRSVGPLIAAGSYVLMPFTPAELEAAIVRPAARAGIVFDDGIVAELIAEAITSPGSLPLLQFTLTELYDLRGDGAIGRPALDRLGGMAGAIGRRAEEVFAALDEARQADARALYGRLVAPGGPGALDSRRRAALSELSPGMREVADRFVAARLLVADRDPATREPTVEVAHEALLACWPRLVTWVDEDRRWLTQLQHLAAAARAWDDARRPDTELYRGARLDGAIEAIDVDGRMTSPLEREFVDAGRRAHDAEVRVAEHAARRLRRLLAVAVVALVVAVLAAAVALVQRSRADDSAAEARAQAALAEAAAVDAQIEALVGRSEALRDTQRDVAALLAVEAYRLADTARSRSVLLGTFTDSAGFLDTRRLDNVVGHTGIVMPDGESAYIVDRDGRLRPYGLDSGVIGDPLAALDTATTGTFVLAASADGRWIAQVRRSAAGDGSMVGVFDTDTAVPTFAPLAVDGAVLSAAFTPDGDALALAVGEEARMLVVETATGDARGTVAGVAVPPRDGVAGVEPREGTVGAALRSPAVVAAGDELLLGAADGSLRVFDPLTLELRRTLALAPDTLASLVPLDDGTLLTAGRLGVARVERESGRVLWRREQGLASIGDGSSPAACAHLAAVDQRGAFFCANAYGRLTEHDLDSGVPVRILEAQNGNSGALWVARSATELVSFGDSEPAVTRRRLDASGPITHLVAPGYRAWSFSPDGDRLLVERGDAIENSQSQVIDVDSGDVVRHLHGLLNPDWLDDGTVTGATINATGEIETARADIASGHLVAEGYIVERGPTSANRDTGKERTLVLFQNGPDATLYAFEPRAQQLGPEIVVDGYVSSAISATGHRIAVGTVRGVEIHDGFTGEQVTTMLDANSRGVFITVTDQLFVSSLGGELTHYDLETLERIRTFGGSRGHITQLVGTADGTTIAINADHQVILYDVATGLRIGTPIEIPDDDSNWIALSLDGRWLAVGGDPELGSRASQIWSLEPQQWVTAACRVAGRNLTEDEWASTIDRLAPYRATCPGFPAPSTV